MEYSVVFYVHAVGADCSLLTAGVANFLARSLRTRLYSRGHDHPQQYPPPSPQQRHGPPQDRLGTVAPHLATGQVEDDGERHLRAAPAAGVLGWLKGLVGRGDGA